MPAIDHNRLSHYRPHTGDDRMLQDRESRGHWPTKDTPRLLTGLKMQKALNAIRMIFQGMTRGCVYAS
jgi:hypothetical protein